jgi:hypothetical protein
MVSMWEPLPTESASHLAFGNIYRVKILLLQLAATAASDYGVWGGQRSGFGYWNQITPLLQSYTA